MVWNTGDEEVTEAANFASRSPNWLTPGDHNHLRITRILKSLSLLGLESDARAFYKKLAELAERRGDAISPRTFQFWSAAVGYFEK